MISTNQFKNGNHIDVEGTVFKILEFQHVKPGKGGAFVRTKLRRASDGNVIDRTFRAGEKFRSVRTESRTMQFLYADGADAHLMDTESFEQIAIPEAAVQDGPTVRRVRARELAGTEKQAWWDIADALNPAYARYRSSAGRDIPILALEPVE